MEIHRTIYVCKGTGCVSGGGEAIYEALKTEVDSLGLNNTEVDFTGCHGFCQQGPNVVVEPDGIFYTHVEPEDAVEIVTSHLRDGKPVERLFYQDPVTGQPIPCYSDINFYQKQERITLRNCGHINPEKIDDYLARGGYEALQKVLWEAFCRQYDSRLLDRYKQLSPDELCILIDDLDEMHIARRLHARVLSRLGVQVPGYCYISTE